MLNFLNEYFLQQISTMVNVTNGTKFGGSCGEGIHLGPYLKSAIYSIILVASLVGNIAIICIVHRTRRLHNPTNYLIVNLAVSDLLGSVINIPIAIAVQLRLFTTWSNDFVGRVSCALLPPLQGFFTYCSWFSITVIAVDRFCAVMFPLRHVMSPCVINICLAATWLLSLFIISPLFYAMKVIKRFDKYVCLETWEPLFDTLEARKIYTIFLFFTSYVFPLVVIVPLYSCVIHRVWFRTVPGNVTDAIQRVQSKSKKRVLRMLVTVVVMFVLCCFPFQIHIFLQYNFNDSLSKCAVTPNVTFVMFSLVFANYAINPFIYFAFSKEYCTALCTLLGSIHRACKLRRTKRMSRGHELPAKEVIEIASFRKLNEAHSSTVCLEADCHHKTKQEKM